MKHKNIIFIECGPTMFSPFNTGVQRVVRNIVAHTAVVASELGIDYSLVAFTGKSFRKIERIRHPNENLGKFDVRLNSGKMLLIAIAKLVGTLVPKSLYYEVGNRVIRWIKRLPQRNKTQDIYQILQDKGRLGEGKKKLIDSPILLLLDSTWEADVWIAAEQFRTKGGHVCAVLYDLIPFTHPETVSEAFCFMQTQWCSQLPAHVDSVMCISQSVRDEFLVWQQDQKLKRTVPPEKVGYFYLGSELTQNDPVIQTLSLATPFFIVVGSLEPRKNHALILDAFDLLWKEGYAVNLVIVGAHGWKSEKLLVRIENHAELGKRLVLIRDATDRDLTALYDKSAALIIASLAEGFGLPIVEAFQRGGNVICSNLPVFNEIAGSHATYFDPFDARSLVEAVKSRLERGGFDNLKKDVIKHDWINWHESARQLFSRVIEMKEAVAE